MIARHFAEWQPKRTLWRPSKRLSLSEWSRRHYYLSAESSAEQGRFRPYKYQAQIMDAISDPSIPFVSVKKSARIGFTKILNATAGYYMVEDPCPILCVQPTVEDAEGYSKEEIATMIRDCPRISVLFTGGIKAKDANNTILHKVYPGGSISMVGANSPRGFRRVSRKVVLLDEIDGYPASAGGEGDPIKLAIKRAEYYHDRKIVRGSTPVLEGRSPIDDAFNAGDQRFFHVPCPHCGHMDRLVFQQQDGGGHWMRWPKDEPEKAHFVCFDCGCEIEESHKYEMTEAGEFVATKPFEGHASFHIWAAYSSSPNATWGQLAQEFEEARKAGPEKLKTFVNLVLGECWKERGEAPDHERLYARREPYELATVPEGVMLITAGVDVQKDRLYYEIVGWGRRKENWSLDAGFILGDPYGSHVWEELDKLLDRPLPSPMGDRKIQILGVDSGAFTQAVYNWARRHPASRVIATKGQKSAKTLISSPSKVDVTSRGRKIGYQVWPIGIDLAKAELYGWLKLVKDGEELPRGWCHFPEYGPEFFEQITAEHLVSKHNKRGFVDLYWELLPNRENHWLDCRVIARAAASLAGLDRMKDDAPTVKRQAPPVEEKPSGYLAGKTPAPVIAGKRPGGFLGGRSGKWL